MKWLAVLQLHFARALVFAASRLSPTEARQRFVAEWRAELMYEGALEGGMSPIRPAFGSFRDALELRRLNPRPHSNPVRQFSMEGILAMLRDAALVIRTLARTPIYTVVASVTLALGLGGTASVYVLLDRVVLDPLPYPDADRMVRLTNLVPGVDPGAVWNLSSAQYFYFSEHVESIDELGLFTLDGANIDTPTGPSRSTIARVSGGLLQLLGATTQIGRSFGPGDDRVDSPQIVLLSDGFWRRQFGADPAVIGRSISVNSTPVEIVGVLSPDVMLPQRGMAVGEGPDVWMTLRLDPAGPFYNHHYLNAVARLSGNTTPDDVTAELEQIKQVLPDVFPLAYHQEFFDRYGFRMVATPLKDYVVQDVADAIWILMGAVGLILLIAGANVVNLFLVRMESRRKELALRTALGANMSAIARPIVVESVVLALIGGVLGLLLGSWAVPTLVAIAPDTLPRLNTVGFGTGGILFTLGLSLVTGLLLAVFPVFQHARSPESRRLNDDNRSTTLGRDRQRLRSSLIVGQVALAMTLVVGAGLLIASLRRLHEIDPGIRADGVLTMRLHLTGERYQTSTDFWRFYSQVNDGVRGIPGVEAAGMSSTLPFGGGYGCTVQAFEDPSVYDRLSDAGMTTCAGQAPTTPGYHESMGIPVLQGRGLTPPDLDDPSRGVVVVSKAFADRFWPGEDPIGKGVAPSGRSQGPFYRVVGVTGNVFAGSVDEEPAPVIYYPVVPIPSSGGIWQSSMQLFVKTNLASPASVLGAVRRVVNDVDPSIPISDAREMQAVLAQSLARFSFMAVLLQIAAGTALLLAAVGLYGVVSYLVSRRTREIGMRIAIGARPGQVERLVVAKSASLLGLGLLLGVIISIGAGRLLESLLFGVGAVHVMTFLTAIGLLSAVTLVASWLPARRASRIDPLSALRAE